MKNFCTYVLALFVGANWVLQPVVATAGDRHYRQYKDICHPNYEPRGGYPAHCFRKYPRYCFGTREFDPRYHSNPYCPNTRSRSYQRHSWRSYQQYGWQPQPRYHHKRGDNDGAAVMLGIVGLMVGAMIADSARKAEKSRRYYPPAPNPCRQGFRRHTDGNCYSQ